MIIDKVQLIQLLVDKTGMDKEEIEAQLLELIKRVNKAAEEDKTFEIEGFGTFSMVDDTLHFAPDEKLETEINNEYAGMKPIELIGAFKEPADEMPDVSDRSAPPSDEESWTFDESAAEEEEEPLVEEPSAADEEQIITLSDQLSEEVEEVLESAEEEEPERAFPQDKSAESQKPPEEKAELEKQKKSASVSKQADEKDTIGRVLVACVIIIALGITGFLVYDMNVTDSNDSAITESSDPPVKEARPRVTGSEESSGDNSEPEQGEEVTKTEAKQDQPQSRYGVRGEVNDEIRSEYTIVVHSLRSLSKAESNRDNLRDQGYRALISRARVNGVMRYRVGIGQFASVEAAQNAIDQIPEPYRENNFIKRIQ